MEHEKKKRKKINRMKLDVSSKLMEDLGERENGKI
jgi:hypothetical protein